MSSVEDIGHIYIYIYMCVCVCVCMYIYRESEKNLDKICGMYQ